MSRRAAWWAADRPASLTLTVSVKEAAAGRALAVSGLARAADGREELGELSGTQGVLSVPPPSEE